MKKLTFALMALLAFSFSLKAQQYVSTVPSNRNVILEEFTGRNCSEKRQILKNNACIFAQYSVEWLYE